MIMILYLSTATSLYDDNELENILVASRKNNERAGVTGILLYHDGGILQVLEGEEATVLATFQRIEKDQRHKAIQLVVQTTINTRSFSNWSMGFRKISAKDWHEIEGYIPVQKSANELPLVHEENNSLMIFLQSFYNGNFK